MAAAARMVSGIHPARDRTLAPRSWWEKTLIWSLSTQIMKIECSSA
jgi:hypothetical protein